MSTLPGFILAGAVALSAVPASTSPAMGKTSPPEVTCTACLLIDDSGRELYARNAGRLLANASTTKMMTALVVIDHVGPEDRVRVSERAAATGGGGLDLAPGSSYSVDALLHALLMTSSNDAAVALAEHIAGTEAGFVSMLNRAAERLGATDTHYVTAHGLDTAGHGSSARDLATIAERLLEHPLLAAIVAKAKATVPGPQGSVVLENRNLLLEGYRGADGVKTGYTADAGNVLVASAERGGRRLIAVAMDSVDATEDARILLDFGWQRLKETILVGATEPLGTVVFDQGSTTVVAESVVRGPHDPDAISVTLRPLDHLQVPIEPGDVVGEIAVSAEGTSVAVIDAVAVEAVPGSDEGWATHAVADLLRFAGRWVGVP